MRSVGDRGPDNHPSVISLFLASKLRDSFVGNRPRWLKGELALEKARIERYSHAVSRLRGVYMFTSMDDALRALAEWRIPGWKPDYISEVQFSAEQLTIVDTEWITEDLFSPDTAWMDRYWSGKTKRTKPLLEVLGIGIGQIQNRALREQAYQNAVRNWPGSTNMLQRAAYGFGHCQMASIAQIRAAMMAAGDKLIVDHLIYMDDFRGENDQLRKVLIAAQERGDFPTAPPPAEQYVPDLKGKRIEIAIPDIQWLLQEAGWNSESAAT